MCLESVNKINLSVIDFQITQEREESNDAPDASIDNTATMDTRQEDDEPVRTPISENSQEIVPPQMERHPNRKRKCTADKKLDEAFEILSQAAKTKEATECQIFGNLVARKLQKYSNEAQTAVQEAIMSILFKADRGYYNEHSARNHPSNIPYHDYPAGPSSSFYSVPQDIRSEHNPVNERPHSSQCYTSHYSPILSPTPSHNSIISNDSTCVPQSQNAHYLLPSSHNSTTISGVNVPLPSSGIFSETLDMPATEEQDFSK